ncbi:MAG: bifunctional oligoribonuclease/PAP phosphatase NrnA [Clostridia bacterium]|nr:bifunctional oligoribonuclease/PAP phosphatase NrnA [Clostridia bacterium]
MFEQIAALIKEYGTVIIHRHSHPDGDALGSQIGLAELIRTNYPQKTVYTVGDAAGRYAFMDGAQMDEIDDAKYNGALAILLDCPTEELVSDKRFVKAAATARIDHHIYCGKFTDAEVIDTSFESAAGMIAFFAEEQSMKISRKAANAIFTGIVTDSGRFRYDSTTSRTLKLAAMLIDAGADPDRIYLDLYARDLESLKRQSLFINKIQIFDNSPVAYIYTTAEELAAMGVTDPASVSRGMVNVMADIRGVDIWVNFTEDGDKVLCELRSSRYNINPVAVMFGGGGHKKASGADVKDRAQAMEMLSELKKLTAKE